MVSERGCCVSQQRHLAATGELQRYSVRITKTDSYDLHERCRVPETNCPVRFLIDGKVLGNAFELNALATWQTLAFPGIRLDEGERTLEFMIENSGASGFAGDFNWFSATPATRVGPNARAGSDVAILDDDWDGIESVLFDAGASIQGSQPLVSLTWLENGVVLANGPNPAIPMSVGKHRIRLIFTDSAGWYDEDEVEVNILRRGFLNGGFENGLTGWTRSGNAAVSDSAGASQGTRALVFGDDITTSNGSVSQSFPATPGQTYRLSFDVGVRAFNTLPQDLRVTVTGESILLSNPHTASGNGSGLAVWSAKNETFTADGEIVTVEFRDVSSNSGSRPREDRSCPHQRHPAGNDRHLDGRHGMEGHLGFTRCGHLSTLALAGPPELVHRFNP